MNVNKKRKGSMVRSRQRGERRSLNRVLHLHQSPHQRADLLWPGLMDPLGLEPARVCVAQVPACRVHVPACRVSLGRRGERPFPRHPGPHCPNPSPGPCRPPACSPRQPPSPPSLEVRSLRLLHPLGVRSHPRSGHLKGEASEAREGADERSPFVCWRPASRAHD